MRHPWSILRSRAGDSQAELADMLNITRHSVLLIESGVLNPSLEHSIAVAEWYDVPLETLLSEYRMFISWKRIEFADKYNDFSILEGYSGMTHPLVYWRRNQSLSRIGMCKGLCISQGPINEYENNRRRGVPGDFEEAIMEIGWDLEWLNEAVKEWRLSGRADA